MTDVLGLAPGIRLTLPPVIGNHIAADRPEFAYLADYRATRPPTADEAAAYLHRYDYPEWKQWPALAEAGIAFESRPLPSPLQAPSLPQCSCARCTDGPDEPDEGQGAPARKPELPAPPEPDDVADQAQRDARERLNRWAGSPDATSEIPAAAQLTEIVPAVTADEGGNT